MKKIVLVTGAYGFIGRNIARHFSEAGWKVIGIGHGLWNRDEWAKWGIAEWYASDITIDALLKYAGLPNVIIHCAGSGSVGFSMSHPKNDFQRTVDTTLAVLEFVRLHSMNSCIVYPSSAAVYGIVQKFPIVESDFLSPISPYGVHKKIAEELCQSYAKYFGVTVAIVRLFSVYGNGLRKQLFWESCQKFMQGEDVFFGTGEELRDWVHIDDVAKLMFVAANNATRFCPVINSGNGQGISVKDTLQYISDKLATQIEPKFSSLKKEGDPSVYIADISKALSWGWKPQVTWQQGIAEYVDWYKKCQ